MHIQLYKQFLLNSIMICLLSLFSFIASAETQPLVGTRILCKGDLYNASFLTSIRSDSSPRYRPGSFKFIAGNQALSNIQDYQPLMSNNLEINAILESDGTLYLGKINVPLNAGSAQQIARVKKTTSEQIAQIHQRTWAVGFQKILYQEQGSENWIVTATDGSMPFLLTKTKGLRLPVIGPDRVGFVDATENVVEIKLDTKATSTIYQQKSPNQILNLTYSDGRWIWLQQDSRTSEILLIDSLGHTTSLKNQVSGSLQNKIFGFSDSGLVIAQAFDSPKPNDQKPGLYWIRWEGQKFTPLKFLAYPNEVMARFQNLELSAGVDSVQISPFDNRIYVSPRFYGGVFSFDLFSGNHHQHATEGGGVRCFQINLGPEVL